MPAARALSLPRRSLLELPWEDVLIPHVLSRLPLAQLLQLQCVCRRFRELVRLHLSAAHSLDLSQVASTFPRTCFSELFQHSSALRELVLTGCSSWLTDAELVPLVRRNLRLRRAELARCSHLSPAGLHALTSSCPGLRRVGLRGCKWLEPLCLLGLAERCPQLESCDVSECLGVTDECLARLAAGCPGLVSLGVALDCSLTDRGVEAVAKGCPRLQHLDISGCFRVTNAAVRTVAEYCPALRSLSVSGCQNVTEPGLARLRGRGVAIDIESPPQHAVILLGDLLAAGYLLPYINLQI
ncbi:unnamed protein product [Lampetra planeri]